MRQIIDYIMSLSIEDHWCIAYRINENNYLVNGNARNFIIIPNTNRYWRADPFIISYNNINCIFAEMFDVYKGKGVIGVSVIKKGKPGRFRICLDLPYHLSYPCLMEKDGDLYMIPECWQSGSVSAYKCVSFPMKWEKCDDIINVPAVDTTPMTDDDGKTIYFTSVFEPQYGGNDNLHIIKNNTLIPIKLNDFKVRCAGSIIRDGDRLIRPCQDDSNDSYGGSLYFKQIDNSDPNHYSEHTILRVLPPKHNCSENEIAIELSNDRNNKNYIGVHTYNCNKDYEVIDLLIKKERSFILLYKNRKKLYEYIAKRIKRKLRRNH